MSFSAICVFAGTLVAAPPVAGGAALVGWAAVGAGGADVAGGGVTPEELVAPQLTTSTATIRPYSSRRYWRIGFLIRNSITLLMPAGGWRLSQTTSTLSRLS